MTVRGTVVLAIVFGLLAAYLRVTAPPPNPAADSTPLLAPSLDGATRLAIEEGKHTTEIVRRDGRWSVPGTTDFLDALASLRVLAVIEPGSEPESYGLGADALRLRVMADSSELMAIEIGSPNPAGTAVYVVRVGQRPVLLVGALLRWELESSGEWFPKPLCLDNRIGNGRTMLRTV